MGSNASQLNTDPVIENSMLEIFSIGAGHAATALSSLMDQTVMISVPQLRIVKSHEMPQALGSVDQAYITTLFHFRDNYGCLLFIVSQEEGRNIVESWMKSKIPADFDSFQRTIVPGVVESGNIIAGAFVNALGEITPTQMILEPPDSAVDFLGGVLDNIAATLDISFTDIFLFDVILRVGGHNLSAYFALIPSPRLLDMLVSTGRKLLTS